jgi:hypothetical protein
MEFLPVKSLPIEDYAPDIITIKDIVLDKSLKTKTIKIQMAQEQLSHRLCGKLREVVISIAG